MPNQSKHAPPYFFRHRRVSRMFDVCAEYKKAVGTHLVGGIPCPCASKRGHGWPRLQHYIPFPPQSFRGESVEKGQQTTRLA